MTKIDHFSDGPTGSPWYEAKILGYVSILSRLLWASWFIWANNINIGALVKQAQLQKVSFRKQAYIHEINHERRESIEVILVD